MNDAETEKADGNARGKRQRGPRVRVARWRPGKKFIKWIQAYSVLGLSESIGVERRTIYAWLNATCAPREDNVRAIETLSRHSPQGVGPLSYEDIHGAPEDL